jgi:two-component system sensor histidine kinase ChiS
MKLVVSWTHTRMAWCIGALMVVLLSILPFMLAPRQAQAQAATSPIELTQGWQYRWDKSPGDETGISICAQEAISSPNWQSFRFPKKLDKPADAKILWLRVPLPAGQWKSPALYLRSVPYILGAYVQNQRIYSQYSLTPSGQAQLTNYQWPIVTLNSNFSNQFLCFQVYAGKSPSRYIGLFDRVTVGSQIDLLKRLIQQELDEILGVFFAFLGLISILLAYNRQEKKSYFSFGVLAILIALYTIARSDLITLFIKNYLLLHYTHYISFYLIPISACFFFEEMFGLRYKKVINALCKIHLIYAVIALPLVVFQLVPWSSTVLPAQILLLSSSLILLIISIKNSRTGNWDAKLFTTGFSTLTLCVIHDVLIYIFEPVHWYQKFYPWGTLIFILCLGFILERRFSEARKRLQAYAIELEKKNADLQK